MKSQKSKVKRGAAGEIRTPKPVRALDPEPSKLVPGAGFEPACSCEH